MDQTSPAVPTGKIIAEPNPLPPTSGALLHLRWETLSNDAEVMVKEEEADEKLLSRSSNHSVAIDWIRPGRSYLFRLYHSAPRTLLDEIFVRQEVVGHIRVADESDSENSRAVTVHWEITEPGTGEVCVAEGEDEKVICRGGSGMVQVDTLLAGINYEFRLYENVPSRPLLAEAAFRLENRGTLTAEPNPIPWDAGSSTTLHWRIMPPTVGEVYFSKGAGDKTLVCRGADGSFEVSQLRPDVPYSFRLYAHDQPDRVLDEVTVERNSLPWATILDQVRLAAPYRYPREVAEIIAALIPTCLRQPDFDTWFQLWEEHGFHVTPVHFYQPIPDRRSLSQKSWEKPSPLVGIDMNDQAQVQMLCQGLASFQEEYRQFPAEPIAGGQGFYRQNGRFEGADSAIAYSMVRSFQPNRIVEAGSGFSTLVLAAAAHTNGHTTLHSIEPYPEEFLLRGILGLASLTQKKIEDIELSFFDELEAGDFFFIDTSHVVKTGGDVNYLFLEILPRLKPGVIVHVHDIFFPFDYPRAWVVDQRRFWTEQYLLQAFLIFNSQFEVIISSGYLKFYHPEKLQTVFPDSAPWNGGSFWMRRKPASVSST